MNSGFSFVKGFNYTIMISPQEEYPKKPQLILCRKHYGAVMKS